MTRTNQDRNRYKKAILAIFGLYVLSLLLVNGMGFCIPIAMSVAGVSSRDFGHQAHVLMNWLQIVPLLFWTGNVGATWVASSVILAGSSGIATVLCWLARACSAVHLVALGVAFVAGVVAPDDQSVWMIRFSTVTFSGFWMICAVVVASVYLERGRVVRASASAVLVGYSVVSLGWVRPAVHSYFMGADGPMALHVQVVGPMVASLLIDGGFALVLMWLGYGTVALVGSSGAEET